MAALSIGKIHRQIRQCRREKAGEVNTSPASV